MNKLMLTWILAIGIQTVSAMPFHNVLDYGVKNDGRTNNTQAINAMISEVARNGGGTLFFPAGDYLSCSINLKSNITLYFDNGAVLIADKGDAENSYGLPTDPYYPPYQDYGHSHWRNGLICGCDLENVGIVGQGTIYGEALTSVNPGRQASDRQRAAHGDKAIGLVRCKNVLIRDITIIKGGWFALLATGVDNLTIDNVTVDTNRDGFNIDCCHDVRIMNCNLNTPKDNAIVLKSTYALGYARATENVLVSNCMVTAKFGSRYRGKPILEDTRYLGAIKFGTESNGGFKNITVSNCVIDHSVGILLESADGGFLENVTFDNIVMRDVNKTPLFIRTCARLNAPEGTRVGHCKRITISNVIAYNVVGVGNNNSQKDLAVMIMGIPASHIEDVDIHNVRIYFNHKGTREMVAKPMAEQIKSYPDPAMWDFVPSYGFYIRHARNIRLSNVHLFYLGKEQRPAFIFDDVSNISLHNVSAMPTAGNPLILLKNVTDFSATLVDGIQDIEIPQTEYKELNN